MQRPQFSLFSILILLTIACGLAAWLSTASRHPYVVVSLNPPARGSPFPNFSNGLQIPPDKHYWSWWWQYYGRYSTVRGTALAAAAMVMLTWLTLLLWAPTPRRNKLARWGWTLGLAWHLAHVACAFAFVHHWSHAEAAWHTGYRTWQMTGWFWTGGIWINYLFTVLWAGDVIYWWSGLDRYARRPARYRWFVHALFAFMIFQAGVVFASGLTRWLTLAGLSLVALAGLVRLRPRQPIRTP